MKRLIIEWDNAEPVVKSSAPTSILASDAINAGMSSHNNGNSMSFNKDSYNDAGNPPPQLFKAMEQRGWSSTATQKSDGIDTGSVPNSLSL